ncbi:dienelactone hydrolase family protein [Streptomyces sp. NPDC002851]
MTVFVLVSEAFTGGWIWREVAQHLRDAGGEVHAVTLTGMGERHELAGPDTDLEVHIQDVLDLLDLLGPLDESPRAGDVVLVGHGYGIHPVLGAADRRPDRVARIVYVDAPLAQDGDPALKAVPDAGLRDRLARIAQRPQDAGPMHRAAPAPAPAPTRDGWASLGSTEGLTPEHLDRLTALAAPQPLGTLTQPLRLTGAAATVPTTGVLCTANGLGIAMLETVVALGDPRFAALTASTTRFFELATGHWPMLSEPAGLAEVLLKAAAGDGARLTPKQDETPPHLRPFLLDVPEYPRERTGRLDLHLPPGDSPRPAILFIHGGPVPEHTTPTPRDWPTLLGYARCAAQLGAVGAVVDHRLHDVTDFPRAAEDVAAAVARLRADPRVDPDRIALWFFSGGGLLTADWLAAPPPWLRCLAATYPVMAAPPNWGVDPTRFHPPRAVRAAGRLPIVLTRVELESPEFAATVAEFTAAAQESGANLEIIDVPGAHHGFEAIDHTEATRQAVRRALRTVVGHLGT